MKKSNALMMMTMLAMTNDSFRQDIIEEEKQRKNQPIKQVIPKNHKEFFYGVNSVWALNKKNADKKAKAKCYICTQLALVIDEIEQN